MGMSLMVMGIRLWQMKNQEELGIFEQTRMAEIELSLEHPQIKLELASDYEALSEWLVRKLGWGQGWQDFSLPRMSESQEEKRASNLKVITRPMNSYSGDKGKLLYLRSVADGLYRGMSCEQREAEIECQLYLGESYFESGNSEAGQRFLTRSIIETVMLLTGQDSRIEEGQKLIEEAMKELEDSDKSLFELVRDNQQIGKIWQNWWLVLKENFRIKEVYAQSTPCSGFVQCYVWERQCRCANGTTCQEGQRQCDNFTTYCGVAPNPACTTVCGNTYDTDEGTFCASQPVMPWGCPSPMGGTCEGINPAYCRTGGSCYPSSPLPTPPPPPPNCSGVCCYSGQCIGNLGGTACGTGFSCCNQCTEIPTPTPVATPNPWPPYGSARMFFFHDVNENERFDSEDNVLPEEVRNSASVSVIPTGADSRVYNLRELGFSGAWGRVAPGWDFVWQAGVWGNFDYIDLCGNQICPFENRGDGINRCFGVVSEPNVTCVGGWMSGGRTTDYWFWANTLFWGDYDENKLNCYYCGDFGSRVSTNLLVVGVKELTNPPEVINYWSYPNPESGLNTQAEVCYLDENNPNNNIVRFYASFRDIDGSWYQNNSIVNHGFENGWVNWDV